LLDHDSGFEKNPNDDKADPSPALGGPFLREAHDASLSTTILYRAGRTATPPPPKT